VVFHSVDRTGKETSARIDYKRGGKKRKRDLKKKEEKKIED
jgi:hypothetical protein